MVNKRFTGVVSFIFAFFIGNLNSVTHAATSSPLQQLDIELSQYLAQYKKFENSHSIEDQELARSGERLIVNTLFENISDENTYHRAFQTIDSKSSSFPSAIADLAFTLQLAWQKRYFQDYSQLIQTQSQIAQAAIVIGLTLTGGIAKVTPEKVKTYFQLFNRIKPKYAALAGGGAVSGAAQKSHAFLKDLPAPPSDLLSLGVETIPLPKIEFLTQELMKDLFIGIEGTLGIGLIFATPTLQLKALATALVVAYATYSYQQGSQAENLIAEWVASHPALMTVIEKAQYANLRSWVNKLEAETDVVQAAQDARKIVETTTRIVSMQMLTKNFTYSRKVMSETLHESMLASEVRRGEFRSDPKSLLHQINSYFQSFSHRNFGNFLVEHYSNLILEPMIVSLQ
jgi:hypothetical protein